ncbi:MAG: malonyl CoA-acyl carrier protein transacylase, partial [Chloroflexi bacterium]|nr:malonyl CoA-acyl carrier protein transacylase [Chloroflexota bacterium]
TFVELGPKGVLKGLLRRIDRSANGIVIETAQDIETLLQG